MSLFLAQVVGAGVGFGRLLRFPHPPPILYYMHITQTVVILFKTSKSTHHGFL